MHNKLFTKILFDQSIKSFLEKGLHLGCKFDNNAQSSLNIFCMLSKNLAWLRRSYISTVSGIYSTQQVQVAVAVDPFVTLTIVSTGTVEAAFGIALDLVVTVVTALPIIEFNEN